MATLDLLELSEAKGALKLANSDSTMDWVLQGYVTAVSLRLDDLCGPIVRRTVTDEAHHGGGPDIVLKYAPVSSVTSVTEYASTTATTLTAQTNLLHASTNYVVDLPSGVLRRHAGGSATVFPAGTNNIVVTYVAGRHADTPGVSERFKQAAAIMVANLWRREQGAGNVTFGAFGEPGGGASFGLPNAVKELLSGELYQGINV